MTSQTRSALEEMLKRHEGLRLSAYQDGEGFWTIGVGRLIDERKGGGITHGEAMQLLEHDIDRTVNALYQRAPWVAELDEVRQLVLVNMAFNLGVNGLLQFTNTMAHIRGGRFDQAAQGMLASKWATQVKDRAIELARIMRTGSLPGTEAHDQPLRA